MFIKKFSWFIIEENLVWIWEHLQQKLKTKLIINEVWKEGILPSFFCSEMKVKKWRIIKKIISEQLNQLKILH